MRHRKSINHLGRTASHRRAMLANMASSLILHKRIQTTTAKAKALRTFVEPLITKSKEDSTHSRRVVFSYLQDKEAVSELFREISPKIADRPGGYTRILKTGTRLGDNADMCIIELVDYNENLLTSKEEAAAKSSRRRRRGGKKKADEQTADLPVAEASGTEVVEETTEDTATDAVETDDQAEAAAEEMADEQTEEVTAEKADKEPAEEAAEVKSEEAVAATEVETEAAEEIATETKEDEVIAEAAEEKSEEEKKSADDKDDSEEKKEA